MNYWLSLDSQQRAEKERYFVLTFTIIHIIHYSNSYIKIESVLYINGTYEDSFFVWFSHRKEDVYQLGLVLLEMATGAKTSETDIPNKYSNEFRDFVSLCLKK
jgi:hypothetical protein